MTTLTSGGTTLLSGGTHLTTTEEEEDDVPLAIVRDTAGSNVQTTSSTIADIDATNYAVTFTAPASGKVIVVMHGMAKFDPSNADKYYQWGIRESTTTLATRPIGNSHAVAEDYRLIVARFYVSGISAGSHTYKGAHKVTAGGSGTSVTDSNDEARTIEVWEDLT